MSAKPQTLYPEKTFQTLEQQLGNLASRPKGNTLRTLIERLKPKIRAAQDAGHTYEDIVKTLGESGVQITVNTLKQYLREPRSGDAAPTPTDSTPTAPAATPMAAPETGAPPQRRRGQKGSRTQAKVI